MKRILAVVIGLIMASAMTMVYAQEKGLFSEAREEAVLLRMEHQWTQGYLTRNARLIYPILADNYVALGPDGQIQTKAELVDEVRTGFVQYAAIHNNPMQVRFFGNIAVVVGSDDENSSRMGMDTSGHYSWADVFVFSGNRWEAVASQGTWVSGPSD